jgi:hypothetical protein
MKKLTQITTFVAVLTLLSVPAFSDTLVLKSGERISGYYEGGSARVIKFRVNDGSVKDFDLLSIQQIQFGDEKTAAAPPPSRATSPNSGGPRLLPGAERVTQPVSSNAATTGWTIPTGSTVVIRMIDSVNSEKNTIGETFVAVLDEPILQGGVEVVPRGSDVRGLRRLSRLFLVQVGVPTRQQRRWQQS